MATDEEVQAERAATEELRAMLDDLKNGAVDTKSVENDITIAAHKEEQERLRREIEELLESQSRVGQVATTTADAQAAMLAAAGHQQAVADKLTASNTTTNTKPPKAGSEAAPAATEAEGK